MALGIASSFDWHHGLFWIYYSLAGLFLDRGGFDDANIHIECAKSHTANRAYRLGRAMELQVRVWYNQHSLEEARSEFLRAADVFEKLGAAKDLKGCRKLLQVIQNNPTPSG